MVYEKLYHFSESNSTFHYLEYSLGIYHLDLHMVGALSVLEEKNLLSNDLSPLHSIFPKYFMHSLKTKGK